MGEYKAVSVAGGNSAPSTRPSSLQHEQTGMVKAAVSVTLPPAGYRASNEASSGVRARQRQPALVLRVGVMAQSRTRKARPSDVLRDHAGLGDRAPRVLAALLERPRQ